MKRKYREKYEKLEISKIMMKLKNIFYVEKEIKNIMINFYLKILEKKEFFLLKLNECN